MLRVRNIAAATKTGSGPGRYWWRIPSQSFGPKNEPDFCGSMRKRYVGRVEQIYPGAGHVASATSALLCP